MSAVGLTKARKDALALLIDWHGRDGFADALTAVGPRMLRTLHDAGLINKLGVPVPRGHAALAAPKMTQAELELMDYIEQHCAIPWATSIRTQSRVLWRLEWLHRWDRVSKWRL